MEFKILFVFVVYTIIFLYGLNKFYKVLRELNEVNRELFRAEIILDEAGYTNFNKINQLVKIQELMDTYDPMPTIYVITPTYERPTQIAELNRLQNTLRLVPKIFWIVIEDAEAKTKNVKKFLRKSGMNYAHLNLRMDYNTSEFIDFEHGRIWGWNSGDASKFHRGSRQRNLAIKWLKKNSKKIDSHGVVYFCDDDNSYNIRIFEEPIVVNNKIVEWFFIDKFERNTTRFFPTDMASFSVNLKHLLTRPKAKFPDITHNCYESTFLSKLITVKQLETKANDCNQLYVWHIRTAKLVNTTKESVGRNHIKTHPIKS